jgi:hypothetical protein
LAHCAVVAATDPWVDEIVRVYVEPLLWVPQLVVVAVWIKAEHCAEAPPLVPAQLQVQGP